MRNLKSGTFGWMAAAAVVTTWTTFSARAQNTYRNPAIHRDADDEQKEEPYCRDLAAGFCPQIPGVKPLAVRIAETKPQLDLIVEDAKAASSDKKLFPHLLTSLRNRGFPLRAGLKDSDLEKHYKMVENGQEAESVFRFTEQSCDQKGDIATVARDIALGASLMIPGQQNFSILSAGPADEVAPLKQFRKSMQASSAASALVNAQGDYVADNQASVEKYGKAYADFVNAYTAGIAEQVASGQRLIATLRPKLQEYYLLCNFVTREQIERSEQSECDAGNFLDVWSTDDISVVSPKAKSDIDRQLVDLRRRAYRAYAANLRGASESDADAVNHDWDMSGRLIDLVGSAGARSEADFTKVVSRVAGSEEIVSEIDAQLSPLVYPGDVNEVKYRILCEKRQDLFDNEALAFEYERVKRSVRRSEAVVTKVREKMYPADQMHAQRELFANVLDRMRRKLDEFAPTLGDDVEVQSMRRVFENLSMNDPNLKKDAFKIDPGTGLSVIDFQKVTADDTFYNFFIDNDLETLTGLGAFMTGDRFLARFRKYEGVNVYPGFLRAYGDHDGAMFFTMSHEIAHTMDPEVFRKLGTRFPPAWQKVLDCLSSQNSVGALAHQHGECFADWFATEVLAATLKEMPKDAQKMMVSDAMLMACEEHLGGKGPAFDSETRFGESVHPSPRKRINAIMGAHPSIRAVLGCRPTSAEAPYCGI